MWGEVGGGSYSRLCQQARFDRICNICSDCWGTESPYYQGWLIDLSIDWLMICSLGSSVADSGVFSNKWWGGQRWYGVGAEKHFKEIKTVWIVINCDDDIIIEAFNFLKVSQQQSLFCRVKNSALGNLCYKPFTTSSDVNKYKSMSNSLICTTLMSSDPDRRLEGQRLKGNALRKCWEGAVYLPNFTNYRWYFGNI